MLLPLTSEKGLLSYLERINALVERQYPDMDLAKLGVDIHKLQLDRNNNSSLKKLIYQECGLNENQISI